MPDDLIDNLKPFIIVAVIVFMLIRKVMEGINANKPSAGPTMEEVFGPDDDNEEPRQPYRPATPPPIRQSVPPPLRQVTVTALAGEMDAEVARQRAMEERIRKIREAKLKAQAAQAHASQPAIVKHEAPTVNRRTLRLHSQKELQRAFILKEILDRPVGLR